MTRKIKIKQNWKNYFLIAREGNIIYTTYIETKYMFIVVIY